MFIYLSRYQHIQTKSSKLSGTKKVKQKWAHKKRRCSRDTENRGDMLACGQVHMVKLYKELLQTTLKQNKLFCVVYSPDRSINKRKRWCNIWSNV